MVHPNDLSGSSTASTSKLSDTDEAASLALQVAAMKAFMEARIKTLWVVLLITYAVLCVLCLALIAYLRRNRSGALRGNATAAGKLVLPAFEPLLWILGAATGLYSLYFVLTLAVGFYPTDVPSIPSECFYGARQFMLLLVVVFMLQMSVTVPALRRAVVVSLALSVYTIPVAWYILEWSDPSRVAFNYWLLTSSHALNIPIFAYVFVRPPGRASKAALRLYCAFALVQQTFEFAYNAAFYQLEPELGFSLAYVQLALGCTCPFFIWRVLKADTEHWRGMGQRACQLQTLFRQRTHVHERISSQGLHLLIEMHRKFVIDFAFLELRHKIGVGASAVVYDGVLHSKTAVAIKVYTPTTVTEETVAEFSHEAALCGALKHPNIVTFYGMCVCPPTICLVSELCQGSLEDVTTAVAARQPREPRRQQLLIDLAYMIDAARAVAYIHSFSPAFVHRDIKPSNFLVDAYGTVKLTDFGESRSLPLITNARADSGGALADTTIDIVAVRSRTTSLALSDDASGGDGLAYVDYQCTLTPEIKTLQSERSRIDNAARSQNIKMTVKGTVDYMAPEMINGKAGFAAYDEAADVYSLAITMWDVLHPGVDKYPNSNNHLRVFEAVLHGSRPELDAIAHPSLRELLAQSWHQDHWRRPSAQTIVQTLERIQDEVSATFAHELLDELQHDDAAVSKADEATGRCVSGECVVARMRALRAVANESEAVRLGNMLMSAGFLHHVQHVHAFESSDETYYFDETTIRLCQPFATLGVVEQRHEKRSEDGTADSTSPGETSPKWLKELLVASKQFRSETRQASTYQSEVSSTEASQYNDGLSSGSGVFGSASGCACRRLGQRVQSHRSSKRLFQRKHAAIPEHSVLTAALLEQDIRATGYHHGAHDAYDTEIRNRQQQRASARECIRSAL